ncbi:MAG TPA: hypothetical protein VF006_30550 [Longimicrobium sp.]
MITLHTNLHPGSFVSRHHMVVPLANSRHLINLSGVAVIHFNPPGDGRTFYWSPERLELGLGIEALLPRGKWFWIEQWVPFLTLNAFDVQVPPDEGFLGGGWYSYPGIAVDSFWLSFPWPTPSVTLVSDIAVKNLGSTLYRAAYHVNLVGLFVDPPAFG